MDFELYDETYYYDYDAYDYDYSKPKDCYITYFKVSVDDAVTEPEDICGSGCSEFTGTGNGDYLMLDKCIYFLIVYMKHSELEEKDDILYKYISGSSLSSLHVL